MTYPGMIGKNQEGDLEVGRTGRRDGHQFDQQNEIIDYLLSRVNIRGKDQA